jgi:hypothetical protein
MKYLIRKIQTGDIIVMKKQHPCGGNDWVVYRVGADIGLHCNTCERRVMMSRNDVEKRIKSDLSSER